MVGDILQPTHLVFILVVALLVLGPKRLPEVGRTLGSGLRDFRQAINGEAHSHDEREPKAYVETEPDDIEPETDMGPAFSADEPATDAADDHTAEHEHTDEPTLADEPTLTDEPMLADEPESAASHDAEDLDAATSETATASHDEALASGVPTAQPAPPRAPAASSAGFASALAASRQRTSGDDEPADDE